MRDLNPYNRILEYQLIRHLVIDNSVIIEEIASGTLSRLLGIKMRESKAFGYSSESLSFNHKIVLMQDIVGLENEKSKKIRAFSQIRNKFAHVRSVNSWENFFSLSKTYTNIKKDLEKWYLIEDDLENINSEDKYKILYHDLTLDISDFFFSNELRYIHNVSNQWALTDFNEYVTKFFEIKAKENPEINKMWLEIMENIRGGALRIEEDKLFERLFRSLKD